jgi:Heavy metal associated domain 2
LEDVGYQVVHAIAGRIRIRIPWLESDADGVGRLQRLLESLNFVTDVRVNPIAQSIIITYRASAISSQAAVERFVDALQQVKPTPVATMPQDSHLQEEPFLQMAQTVAQTVAQTLQSVAQAASSAVQQPSSDRPPSATTTVPSPQQSPSPEAVPEMPTPWDDPDGTEMPATVIKSTSTASAASPMPPVQPTPTPNTPGQPELWLHSTASLAKRLNVTSQAITRRRGQPDFSTWTQKQDPEGVAWSYDANSQSFYPFTPFVSPLEQSAAEPTPETGVQ